MREKLRELRISTKTPSANMVEVVQSIYPKYDKTMQSKCERGAEYGIDLKPDAFRALTERFAPEASNVRHNDGHRLKCRISCRLEDDEYDLLQRYAREEGFDTMQAWLGRKVRQYLKRKAAAEKKMKGAIQMNEQAKELPIVGVNFKSDYTGDYGGKEYNYFCTLPVSVGDIVIVPTAKGESVARVSNVNVQACQIDKHILPMLKTITAFADTEEA